MRLPTVLMISCLAVLAWGYPAFQMDPREELNQGVRAYKSGRHAVAIEHFKRAVELDPRLTLARLYLATAYANQYIPGSESEENQRLGQAAVEEFKHVLESEPDNARVVAGIASIYFNMKKLDDAREWYQRLIQLDPQNPEGYYSVGVIGWQQTYPSRMALKARLGLPPDAPIPNDSERETLCAKNLPIVEESLRMLNRAIELRPDYDDAMAYLNLMNREKADCESDPNVRAEHLKQADDWVAKVLEIKRKKAEAGPASLPPPASPGTRRIRVDGLVQQQKLLSRVDPVYPPEAENARIQGTVRLDALIGVDGTVQALKVISGHPLLVQAAMDAVKQCRYSPTLMNGEPVEVATIIEINFTLPR